MTIKKIKPAVLFLVTCVLMLSGFSGLQAQSRGGSDTIRVFNIDGAIGPATSDYIVRGLDQAEDDGVYMAIITMDTPGGLDMAMRDIIQRILEADIPVATYVSPQGARAASAGTYILFASHVAAMAPATNLGSATPVQIGLPSLPDADGDDGAEDDQDAVAGAQSGTAMERKIINDAIAYIRGLAELHGRNVDWAETAVRDAANLTSTDALDQNVIDIVAENLEDLLAQMNGMEVRVDGRTVVLDTEGKTLQINEPDWRAEFLSVITNPNLILILGMLGVYGLIIEFYNPGFGFAGITGAICLLLAAYGLQLLPINYVGLGLVIFGLILIVAEALVPSFGIMGVGGVISFVIGSIILVDTEFGVYQVSLPLIAAVAAAAGLLLVITLRIFLRIRHQPAVSGMENFIGHIGRSVGAFDKTGMVKVDGELWQAVTDTPLQEGDKIRIQKVNGLELEVTKA